MVEDNYYVVGYYRNYNNDIFVCLLNTNYPYSTKTINFGSLADDNDFRSLFECGIPFFNLLDVVFINEKGKIVKRNEDCCNFNEEYVKRRLNEILTENVTFLREDDILNCSSKINWFNYTALYGDHNEEITEHQFITRYLDASIKSEIIEKTRHIFKKDPLRPNNNFLPSNKKFLFLSFSSDIDWSRNDPTDCIITTYKRKCIKHVLEHLSTHFVRVVIERKQLIHRIVHSFTHFTNDIKDIFWNKYKNVVPGGIKYDSEDRCNENNNNNNNHNAINKKCPIIFYDEHKKKNYKNIWKSRSVIIDKNAKKTKYHATNRLVVTYFMQKNIYMIYDRFYAIPVYATKSFKELTSTMKTSYKSIFYLAYRVNKSILSLFKNKKRIYLTRCKPPLYDEMKFIAKTYIDEKAMHFYDSQRVVFLNESMLTSSPQRLKCFDFSNFYANVLLFLNADVVISRILTILKICRSCCGLIKQDIVSLTGNCKHFDQSLYNRMKFFSVAIMTNLCQRNSDVVVGATTDGLLLNTTNASEIPHLIGSEDLKKFEFYFPYKLELEGCFYFCKQRTTNCYVCTTDDERCVISMKGFVGREKKINLFDRLLSYLLKALLRVKRRKSQKCVTKVLFQTINAFFLKRVSPSDFIVQNVSRRTKMLPRDFIYNELCQERDLVYYDSRFDDRIKNKNDSNTSIISNGLLNVNACFGLDAAAYMRTFDKKISVFLRFCKSTLQVTDIKQHKKTLISLVDKKLNECLNTNGNVVMPGAIWRRRCFSKCRSHRKTQILVLE